MSIQKAPRRAARSFRENGAALIELASISPLLLLLFLGVMDLGRALNTYIALSHIAAEGVRSAAAAGDLEGGTFISNLPSQGEALGLGHTLIHSRVRGMLEVQHLPISAVSVTSNFNANTTGSDRRTVSVAVSGEFDALLPFLGTLRIDSQKRGPYLF